MQKISQVFGICGKYNFGSGEGDDCEVLHMGNSTTNRVESAYSRLKKYLTSSMGDLSTN